MRRAVRSLGLPFSLAWLALGCAPAERAAPSTSAAAVAPPEASRPARTDVDAAAFVAVRDSRGRPQLVRGLAPGPSATGGPEARARTHLRRLAFLWSARPVDVDSLRFVATHAAGAGGSVIVSFVDAAAGRPWEDGDVRVALAVDGTLIAVRGILRVDPGLEAVDAIDAKTAIEQVLAGAGRPGAEVSLEAASDDRFGRAFTASDDGATVAVGRVRPVWFDAPRGPVTSHRIEVRIPGAAPEARRVLVASADGSILRTESLVHSDTYTYRVYADPVTSRPEDGPTADVSPYPGGAPDGMLPAYVAPTTITLAGIAHPGGGIDPWIPGNVTTLAGNHSKPYADRVRPDGLSAGDLSISASAAHTFDATYDFGLDALADVAQARAAATQAFYVTSYLHDWYYGSGFDELAGNAQTSNGGRGGIEGDALHLETQNDGNLGARDNANMQAFSDGMSPVMQVYLWTQNQTPIVSASGIGALTSGPALFGPAAFTVNAPLVLAADAAGAATDACEPLTIDATGRVVLADRGLCNFETKTLNAQAAGAVALVIADDVVSSVPLRLADDPSTSDPVIPTVSVLSSDGVSLKNALSAGAVTFSMSRVTGVLRDVALDSNLVAHEWGHYLHLRSLRCSTIQCGSISEGMADFVALHLMLRAGDDLAGAFAVGSYSGRYLTPSPGYFGVRRSPYSTVPTRNALSFRHIGNGVALPTTHPMASAFPDNAEVHNAGEVWASMLWDGYVGLVRDGGLPFETARRTMSDILVASVRLSPDEPTFLGARDAVVAAAELVAPTQTARFASAFAGRGAGTCAIGPAIDSTDLVGVVEDGSASGRMRLGAAVLLVDHPSCDWDGFLDAGETGRVRIRIANTGLGPLASVDVGVTFDAAVLSFPQGSSKTVGPVPPMGYLDVDFPVVLAGPTAGDVPTSLTVAATSTAACDAADMDVLTARLDADSVLASSATDDCESDATAWFVIADPARDTWRFGDEPGNVRHWSAHAPGFIADRWLLSPTLSRKVGQTLRLEFDYRHDLEHDPISGALFDAVVLEISPNGGTSWFDAATLGTVPYPAGVAISGASGNPLAGRRAFGGRSPGYPAWQHATVTIPNLAGTTVRYRFRVVSDLAAASGPFDLDNLVVGGVVETPFATVVADPGGCIAEPPDAGMADAGLHVADGSIIDLRPVDSGCSCSAAGDARSRPSIPAAAVLAGIAILLARVRTTRANASRSIHAATTEASIPSKDP